MQPRSVLVLRLVMFALIALATGLGGGLAYKLLAEKEHALFERQYLDAVSILEVRVRRAISDRVTTISLAQEIYPVPPGGKVSPPPPAWARPPRARPPLRRRA